MINLIDLGVEKTVREVSVHAIERLFNEIYGIEVEIVAEEEWNNDTYYMRQIDGRWIGKSEYAQIQAILDGERIGAGTCRLMLTKMFLDSYIPAGAYLVEVSW